MKTLDTGFETMGDMILLSNDTVVCSGPENETEKLKQYSLVTGDLLCSLNVKKPPGGKAEVSVAGTSALAMSMGYDLCCLLFSLADPAAG